MPYHIFLFFSSFFSYCLACRQMSPGLESRLPTPRTGLGVRVLRRLTNHFSHQLGARYRPNIDFSCDTSCLGLFFFSFLLALSDSEIDSSASGHIIVSANLQKQRRKYQTCMKLYACTHVHRDMDCISSRHRPLCSQREETKKMVGQVLFSLSHILSNYNMKPDRRRRLPYLP